VSTKNSTTTKRVYRIEKQRLLVGTCQVVTNPNWPRCRRRMMTEAKLTWSIWQVLLNTSLCMGLRPSRLPSLRRVDHRHGHQRRGTHHHPVGPGPGAARRLESLESFAEYGSWHQDRVTWALTHLIADAPGRIWYGYHVSAV